MNLEKLNEVIKNEPSYKKEQVKRAIFVDAVEDWDQASTLSKKLRNELKDKFPIDIKGESFYSKDGQTIKTLISLDDDKKIEAVLMRHDKGRNTVCVSSQVGCSLGCKFCATGKMGFIRNLTYSEIVIQLLYFVRLLKKEEERVTNIVFMGMGEPFLNYDNVMTAVRKMNDKECFNIGARHISISTSGIVEGIEKLSQENLQVNLAISLHAPNEKLRSEIMPVNNKYPLSKVMEAVENYIDLTRRKVMFEYVMIDGVNDGEEEAWELAEIMRDKLCFVNLIFYNPTGVFKPSKREVVENFKDILTENNISVTQRYRFGVGIDAACGQLATKKEL